LKTDCSSSFTLFTIFKNTDYASLQSEEGVDGFFLPNRPQKRFGIKIAGDKSYQNRCIMSNQQKSTNSRLTFWLCLVLHLGLGGILYYQTQGNDLAKKKAPAQIEQQQQPAVSLP